jgi:pimeloyl-ACP methyl ester carboxylesterase
MPFYENGDVRIHYAENGAGFPLLLIPGGGLNATMKFFTDMAPFNALADFADEYRCVTLDSRNAPGGQSSGPVDPARTWDAYTDDHLGVMDHLGIDRFAVMGFCIGGPFIWNMIRRAPERVVAAALVQPSGHRASNPTQFYDNNMKGWGPALCEKRGDVSMETVDAFLTEMYTNRADFVFTIDRDFARNCQTPLLVMPDDIPPHPYEVAMESAHLAPNAEVSLYPWKDTPENTALAVRHARTFLRAYTPAG